MYLRAVLPQHHVRDESKALIEKSTGIIATIAALVLGLLIASAKSSFDAKTDELTRVSAQIVFLDRGLAQYGPQTQAARTALRRTVSVVVDQTWPRERRNSAQSKEAPPQPQLLYDQIEMLVPTNDNQRFLKSQALDITVALGQTRWLLYEQQTNTVSLPLLVILVSWLTIIFVGLGLFAPVNATAVVALGIGALSASGAIFLILELYSPFQGLIEISSAPLRNALEHLGR